MIRCFLKGQVFIFGKKLFYTETTSGECGTMPHCYKAKYKEWEDAKNTKDEDEFAFGTQHGSHSENVCKWIMDIGATKHMTLYMPTFVTYEVIYSHNVRLGDDSVVEAIRMGSVVVGVETKGIRNKSLHHGCVSCGEVAS